MNVRIYIIVFLILFISSCSKNREPPIKTPAAEAPPSQLCGLTTDNETCETVVFPEDSQTSREYILHTPSVELEDSPPLFIFLHGAGGLAGTSTGPYGIRKYMTSAKFIGAFLNAKANEIGFRDWEEDDVEFISFVIDQLILNKNIDPDRVYIFGYSNGGFMANLAGCRIPSKVTAIFSFAGNLIEPLNNCATDGNVAVHNLHATGDEVIPYNGIDGAFLSAPEAIEEWSVLNQCDASFIESGVFDLTNEVAGDDSMTRSFENCIKPVQLTTIEGSGHSPLFQTLNLQQLMSDFFTASQM